LRDEPKARPSLRPRPRSQPAAHPRPAGGLRVLEQ